MRERSALTGLLRSCFARTQTWLQAGKYVSALASELPSANGWSVAEHAGDRTPGKSQRLLNRASWDEAAVMSQVDPCRPEAGSAAGPAFVTLLRQQSPAALAQARLNHSIIREAAADSSKSSLPGGGTLSGQPCT